MISVVIPFYNEKENLPILIDKLTSQLEKIGEKYEIILIDDGSDDEYQISNPAFRERRGNIKNQKEKIKIFIHRKRRGKGEALKTGVTNASGDLIVFMDADLQDDPEDLPKFIKKINQGYDFVNGVRVNRQENFLVKLYSKIAGWFLKTFLHSPFSDINCGFKVFKKEVLQDFVFYGNNFRFFPLYVFYQGFKVGEVEVKNNPRRFGKSKFGKGKIFVGLLDLITALFLFKFSEKPLHFFGILGGLISFIGLLILGYLGYERIFHNVLLYRRPILWFGILMVIVGLQILATGIIGELIVYFENKRKLNS
ncbi:MAG: glycosyltransferase family 2 protein [Microgenomates group bacterium]